jgi:hypothetical protein
MVWLNAGVSNSKMSKVDLAPTTSNSFYPNVVDTQITYRQNVDKITENDELLYLTPSDSPPPTLNRSG